MKKDREYFLKTAGDMINGPRADDYGPALINHERIATIWSVILRRKLLHTITPAEVTAMMVGLKLARLAEDMNQDDSWVDIIGYAALGGEISNDEE
jgi:CRP-like cAMP-binding protein